MPPHRAHWTHLAHPDKFSKKNTRRRRDINGQHGKPQPLLPGHVQVIERRITFDGWEDREPDGKAEFKPDSTCPPDRNGLGWQINRDGKMRPRNIYPANGDDGRRWIPSYARATRARLSPHTVGQAGPMARTPSTTKNRDRTEAIPGYTTTTQTTTIYRIHDERNCRRTSITRAWEGASCSPSCFPLRNPTTKSP